VDDLFLEQPFCRTIDLKYVRRVTIKAVADDLANFGNMVSGHEQLQFHSYTDWTKFLTDLLGLEIYEYSVNYITAQSVW